MEEKVVKSRRSKAYLQELDKYILEQLVSGVSPISLINDLCERDNKMKPLNARFRIRQVLSKLVSADETELNEKAAKYRECYLSLYRQAYEDNNIKQATKILDSLVKLDGLLIERSEVKVEGEYIVKFE